VATVEQRRWPHSAVRQGFDGSRVMTVYLLFAGVGILIYAGAVLTEASVSRFSGALVGFALPVALAWLAMLAAILLSSANRLLGRQPSRIGRAAAWRTRIVTAALVFLTGGIAILIAAAGEPGDVLTCAGQCGGEDVSVAGEASVILPNGSQAAAAVSESARALAGRTLFQERGCLGCHRPDGTGDGPTLHGLFGSPVQDPACGVAFVDESYLSEAILNPSATLAVGFPPIMPTFAGQLTEEELQTLIVYLKSLSAPVQVQRR
jgi:mono/diheme cytochrome c family protein